MGTVPVEASHLEAQMCQHPGLGLPSFQPHYIDQNPLGTRAALRAQNGVCHTDPTYRQMRLHGLILGAADRQNPLAAPATIGAQNGVGAVDFGAT